MKGNIGWRLAFRNLVRNKRRSISTAIGLTIAFVGISQLFGYLYHTEIGVRAFEVYVNYKGQIQIYRKGGGGNVEIDPNRFQIAESTVSEVQKILKNYSSEIEFIATLQSTEALLSNGTVSVPIWLRGLPPELETFVFSRPLIHGCCPHFLEARSALGMEAAVQQHPDSISISHGVSELLSRVGDLEKMPLEDRQVSIAGLTFAGDLNAVSGTLQLKHTTGMPYIEDVSVFAPLAVVQDLLQTKGVDRFAIFTKSSTDNGRMIASLRKDIQARNLDLEVLPFNDENVGIYYNETTSFLFAMGGFIGVLILIASGLIVMNSITMSIIERLKEIGTMRALGYLPFQIRSVFVKEAFCISLASSLIGIVFSEMIEKSVNAMGLHYEAPGLTVRLPLELTSHPLFYFVLTVSMVAVAVFLSFLVVTRKSKENITELLMDSGGKT
jgi:putative ABC transport system permease protein